MMNQNVGKTQAPARLKKSLLALAITLTCTGTNAATVDLRIMEATDIHVHSLTKVEGIDAILFGHAHQPFPSEKFSDIEGADVENGTLNGVPAVMPGFWGSHLGVVDLTLEVNDGQ